MSTRKELRPIDVPAVSIRGKALKVFTQKTTLTSAQVLALFTTPISLVSAPGVGFAILVHRVTGGVDYNSAAYATNTTQEVRYTNGAGTKVSADITSLVTATADKFVSVGGIEAATVLTENAAVVVCNATGNPATGNSPVSFTVDYSIVSL
jgi:hypothetical protein